MKAIFIALVLLVCTSMYTEAKKGKGGWLKKLCDVDPKELECPSGQKPRLFKGSDCSSITDGDDGDEVSCDACLVCSKKAESTTRKWWKKPKVVAKNGNEIDLTFTFPCVNSKPDFKNVACDADN